MHDLPSMKVRSTLNSARGCNLYALDASRPNPSLCAAVRRTLHIFDWDGNDFVEVCKECRRKKERNEEKFRSEANTVAFLCERIDIRRKEKKINHKIPKLFTIRRKNCTWPILLKLLHGMIRYL